MSSATREMVAKTAALGEQAALQAKESARQVEETAQSLVQAQRHHEQSLMPIVWVSLNCSRISVAAPPGVQGTRFAIGVSGKIINSGPGPATAIYLHLKVSAYHPTHAEYLGLLGPNSDRDFSMMFELGPPHQALEWFPWECLTRYRTIFDTEGAIAQHSHSGKAEHGVVSHYIQPSDQSEDEIRTLLATSGLPTQLYS